MFWEDQWMAICTMALLVHHLLVILSEKPTTCTILLSHSRLWSCNFPESCPASSHGRKLLPSYTISFPSYHCTWYYKEHTSVFMKWSWQNTCILGKILVFWVHTLWKLWIRIIIHCCVALHGKILDILKTYKGRSKWDPWARGAPGPIWTLCVWWKNIAVINYFLFAKTVSLILQSQTWIHLCLTVASSRTLSFNNHQLTNNCKQKWHKGHDG